MSKITSTLGPLRGRTGNLVFSNTKTGNVVRQYQPDVKNPRTDPQILVRAKMRPASTTYQKLQQILNHSFNRQSVMMSRNDFMKFALRAEYFPYMEKGYVGAPIPGDYRITAGALNTVTAQVDSDGIRTNIIVPAGAVMTGKTIVNAEENADMIAAKDQLTWIMFGVDAYDTPRWFYTRINVEDTDDPLPVSFKAINGFLRIGKPANMQTVLAGCVIRTSLTYTFMYSSEKLELNEDLYAEKYMNSNAYLSMLQSYKQNATAQSSDLYLDELTGDQPTTDSLPKYTTRLVSMYGKFGAPTDNKYYWAQVYAVSFAGKQYILTGTNFNNVVLCVNPKGIPMGVKLDNGTVVQVEYNKILEGYRNSFDGTWDVGDLENIGVDPVPSVPFFTLKGQNVAKYLQAFDGKVTRLATTDIAKAVHVALGEQVEVEGVTASYIVDADSLQPLTYEIDTDVNEPLVLRSGVVGVASGSTDPVFNQLRIDEDGEDAVMPLDEGTPIVYEEVNNE